MSWSLYFIRHGETLANQQGVRSGGDMDIPLSDRGRQQAAEAAQALNAVQANAVGLIISSSLQRTRETAGYFAQRLLVPVQEQPLLNERRLGAWNGLTIAETEAQLRAGITPPGGESSAEFTERIRQGLLALLPLLPQSPLVVASKGVGRVMMTLLTGQNWVVLGNCQMVTLRFPALDSLQAELVS